MNAVKLNPTEEAHQDLMKVLLESRILINGLPLTGNELSKIIRGEQMLFAKATQLDKANAPVANEKDEKNPDVIPFKQPKKKE